MSDHLASRALTTELRNKVRQLGLVLWLDADRNYTAFVDALPASGFPYPVVALRGSYLELMLALERYANDAQPDCVVVHLPGLHKETVKETPVYELYKAGKLFEKNLSTLVKEAAVGVATPEEVEAFLRAPDPTLEAADAWLDSLRAHPTDKLSLLLSSLSLEDVAFALITGDARLRSHLPSASAQLLDYLEKNLGLSAAWKTFLLADRDLTDQNVSLLVSSWLMAVEFVGDLREPPATPQLQPLATPSPWGKECRRLASRFRERYPGEYETAANDVQDLLVQERTAHDAGALGSIDTFQFEEAATRAAAIAALRKAEWTRAAGYAADRTTGQCFWVQRSPALQRTWELLRLAAAAGQSLDQSRNALRKCGSLDEAVERYADKLAAVDRNHRLFEQRAQALLHDAEDHDALLEVRRTVRRAWREWADELNRSFFDLCVAHGPLPGRSLRQRAIYEDVVHPLIEQGERVALFLVDALRFEMAQGLAQELKREKFVVTLRARLAELPTDTAIGMNALAPVEVNGRLRPVIDDNRKKLAILGFTTPSNFSVCTPAARVKAMAERSLGTSAEDLELEEFHELSLPELKKRLNGNPRLVVVRSRELDDAGETGLHLSTFDASLRLLRSAISLLQQAGITRFVVTADHGFLLQDATAENVPFSSNKQTSSRRYALLAQPSGMTDVLETRLSALEYDTGEDLYLVLRPDTALWKTKDKIASFVHGGNSLQERVIPVLLLDRHVTKGKTISKYEVVARAEAPGPLGHQRLRLAVRLQQRENASLSIVAPKAISLALRVPGRSDVVINLIEAALPAKLDDGHLVLPPNKEEALVEFSLEGLADEKVRIEVYHPDAVEDVTARLLDSYFEVARIQSKETRAKVPSIPPPASPKPQTPTRGSSWAESIEDACHRRALQLLEQRGIINEAELEQIYGSVRRARAFARAIDELARFLPFSVENGPSNQGLKVYVRKD